MLKPVLCCVVVSFLVFAPLAWAIPVLPGTSTLAVGEPDPVGGAVVGGPLVTPLVGAGFTATLTSTVIAGDVTNPFGGLTFVYDLANSALSTDALGRLTITGYDAWLTDMSFQAPPVGVPPTTMDRSVTGDVVGFNFIEPPLGITQILPGATSARLVVQTNSPIFGVATGNLIDGAIASGPAYAPTVIPVPASVWTGLVGLGALLACRRWARARRMAS